MNIFLVINNVAQAGGTEKALLSLSQILKENYSVTIISLTSSASSSSFYNIDTEINIIHLGLPEIPEGLKNKFFWYRELYLRLGFFKTKKVDMVFTFGHGISIFFSVMKLRHKMKVFSCEHTDYSLIPSSSKVLISRLYKYLDGIIVLNNHAKSVFLNLNKNTVVIPNYITREDLDKVDVNNRILMVGRLTKSKGYDRLLPIAKLIAENFSNWKIDICGDGDYYLEFSKILEKEKIFNVNLLGNVSNINEMYRCSDIFIMTSYSEAMPFVILEAKAYKLPIVAYCNGGTELLVNDSVDGYLIPSDDPNLFFEKIRTLINNQDLRTKFGETAYTSLHTYDKGNIYLKWNRFINENTKNK